MEMDQHVWDTYRIELRRHAASRCSAGMKAATQWLTTAPIPTSELFKFMREFSYADFHRATDDDYILEYLMGCFGLNAPFALIADDEFDQHFAAGFCIRCKQFYRTISV